jgi:hypothetical protein
MSRESPDALATRLIAETQLNDTNFREYLWQRGKLAINGSHDPMILLALSIDAEAGAIGSILRITAPSPCTRRSSVRHSKRYMVPRSCCGNCRRTKKSYTVIRSKMRDNSDQ